MFNPEDRKVYTEALCPPPGYVFDSALATTYTLDLTTLLTVPLSLALAEADRPEDVLEDGVALLEAIKRTARRISIYCETGRISVPGSSAPLFGLLEQAILQVQAPNGGVFHPKLWVVRFVSAQGDGLPLLRLLVLSRNLTADRSWDLSLLLEGNPEGSYVAQNRSLGEFIAGLPRMCLAAPGAEHIELAQQLADEVRRTKWNLPPGFEEYQFHVIGQNKPRNRQWLPGGSSRMVVMSPFLTGPALKELAGTTAERLAVISRWEELDKLSQQDRERFQRCLVLHEAAVSEDGDEPDHDDSMLRGLHAKAYVFERGWNTHVVVGSANATSAALLNGNNVEVLVELVGKRSRVGHARDLVESEAMSALLTDYVPRDDGEQPEDGDSSEEDLLNAARKAIGSANLTVRCRPLEEQLWQLSLAGMPACGVEELKSVKAWPVTLQANSAVVCWTDPAVEDLPLGKVETQSVTGLIAFESTAPSGENRVRFVLNLPVDGMPEHRDAAIVAGVVSSEQKFLRYLRMLLGGLNDADGPGGGLMRRLSRALSGGGAGGLDEAPLLEELTRAFTRHPARLDAVSRLVEQLRSVPETANVLPERFLELWAIFEQAREGTS